MRDDQYLRLQTLSEKLADVCLFDADPDNWVGAGIAAKALTKEERGDAYWCRKVAASSLSVLGRVEHLIFDITGQWRPDDPAAQPALLDDEIRRAELEGERLLKKLHDRSRKTKFDERVHGKA